MVDKQRVVKVYRALCIIRQKLKAKKRLDPDEHYLYLEFALAIIYDGVKPHDFKSKQIMAAIFVVSFMSKIHSLGEISAKALDRKVEMQKVVIHRRDVMVYVGTGRSKGSFCISHGKWKSHAPFHAVGIFPKHLRKSRRIMY